MSLQFTRYNNNLDDSTIKLQLRLILNYFIYIYDHLLQNSILHD